MRPARELAALTVRRLLARVAAGTGRTSRRLSQQRGVAVLMYHRVLRDDEPARNVAPGMYVRESTFRRQLEWLSTRWPIETLGELSQRGTVPAAVAVTFDDGWRDNLTVAWPILKQFGVRPTIFLVGDWVRKGRTADGEFLSPKDVARLAAAGTEFGAHTMSHPHLDRLPLGVAEAEMRRSRDAVEDWTARACNVFAYPFGHYNQQTVDLARQLFSGSVVVGGGWWTVDSDRARIPRIGIHEDMSSSMPLFSERLASAPSRSRGRQ